MCGKSLPPTVWIVFLANLNDELDCLNRVEPWRLSVFYLLEYTLRLEQYSNLHKKRIQSRNHVDVNLCRLQISTWRWCVVPIHIQSHGSCPDMFWNIPTPESPSQSVNWTRSIGTRDFLIDKMDEGVRFILILALYFRGNTIVISFKWNKWVCNG